MRLIDADAALRSLPDDLPYKAAAKRVLIQAETVGAAPVVRCKDCNSCRNRNRKDRIEEAYADGVLWCMNQSDGVWPDDFCSYGERKEND